MSVWTQSNCVITSIGNDALNQIAAKGGTLIFESVWTCGTRVASSELLNLTELPNKNQRMTLTGVKQVSSGYSINVQVTNEDLTTPYSIEMVGVYMKLNGFNEGNPFLYMVLLSDEGSADKMTNISRSTYKYAIYLYHTSKANLQISLTPTDYVATDTYEAGISELKGDILSLVYKIDMSKGYSVDDDNNYVLYTENHETHPFVLPSLNPTTKFPIIVISNFVGSLTGDGASGVGVYIDGVGPFDLIPYDEKTHTGHYFDDVELICVAKDDSTLKVTNYFDDTPYLVSSQSTYTSFNSIPKQEGIYKLTGTATNGPITLTSDKVWTCIVVRSVNTYIMLAVNDYDNGIYRRSVSSSSSWSKASSWITIGGGGGIQTATATFITSNNTVDATARYLRITRDSTVNSLKSGDVIMCKLTALSQITSSTTIYVRYVDGSSYSYKYIYKPDGNQLACCQLPSYFLLEYDGTNFHILTPLNITTTLSSSDPGSTDGKYGDVWYTY